MLRLIPRSGKMSGEAAGVKSPGMDGGEMQPSSRPCRIRRRDWSHQQSGELRCGFWNVENVVECSRHLFSKMQRLHWKPRCVSYS